MSDLKLIGVIAQEVASYKDTEAVEFFEPAGDWRALLWRVERLERALEKIADGGGGPGPYPWSDDWSARIARDALEDKAS